MVKLEEARKILRKNIHPIKEMECVPIMDSIGRILAQDGVAIFDQPPFPRSPLDGYAVKGQDTTGASQKEPKVFQVIGKIYAGQVFEGKVGAGQAVRIMTGAPIPAGADTVIRQEDTDYGREYVTIYQESAPYENYCDQGEDYRRGDRLISKGRKLDGAAVAVLASMGIDQVWVYRKPRVAVISTGDEVMQPGMDLQPGKIYDSNLHYICGRLKEKNHPPVLYEHCMDRPEEMAARIKTAIPQADLIITTGGVSVGEKDIMHQVMKLLSAEKLFWQVDIKPGAPTLAMVCDHTLIISLSGNPYGAAANYELLVRSVLEKLTGDSTWELQRKEAVLQNHYGKRRGVRRFLRGWEEEGKVWAVLGNQASGVLSSLLSSNCLIEIPENMEGAKKEEKVWIHII